MNKLSIIFLFFIFSACETTYQDKKNWDWRNGVFGVESLQTAERIWEITASGNAFTDEDRIRDFVLLKASEIGKENNFSHFSFIDRNKEVNENDITWYDWYLGISNTWNYDMPKQSIDVKFYSENEQMPDNSYSVEIIYNQLAKKYIK